MNRRNQALPAVATNEAHDTSRTTEEEVERALAPLSRHCTRAPGPRRRRAPAPQLEIIPGVSALENISQAIEAELRRARDAARPADPEVPPLPAPIEPARRPRRVDVRVGLGLVALALLAAPFVSRAASTGVARAAPAEARFPSLPSEAPPAAAPPAAAPPVAATPTPTTTAAPTTDATPATPPAHTAAPAPPEPRASAPRALEGTPPAPPGPAGSATGAQPHQPVPAASIPAAAPHTGPLLQED